MGVGSKVGWTEPVPPNPPSIMKTRPNDRWGGLRGMASFHPAFCLTFSQAASTAPLIRIHPCARAQAIWRASSTPLNTSPRAVGQHLGVGLNLGGQRDFRVVQPGRRMVQQRRTARARASSL